MAIDKALEDQIKVPKQVIPGEEVAIETPEREYVEESLFTKKWWKENLFEKVNSDKELIKVASFLTQKYGVRVKIKLVPRLKNDEYAFFDFDSV